MILQAISEHDVMERERLTTTIPHWLKKRHTKAFYVNTTNGSVRAGLRTLMETTGIGNLYCNIIMLGYKFNWHDASPDALWDYVGMISDAFDKKYGVIILRTATRHETIAELAHHVKNYGDASQTVHSDGSLAEEAREQANSVTKHDTARPPSTTTVRVTDESGTVPPTSTQQTVGPSIVADSQKPLASILQHLPVIRSTTAQEKSHSYIDVWWLYDDGGLSMLVPHLLRLDGSYLQDAKIRVFTGDHHVNNVEEERKNVEAMLDKFRISVSLVTVLNTWHQEPTVES